MTDFEKYGPMHSDMSMPTMIEMPLIFLKDIIEALTKVLPDTGPHPVGGLRLVFCPCGVSHKEVEAQLDEETGLYWVTIIG
jgi:hypothetical protein